MATERVYSPDFSEPFDVSPSKATDLVLNKGWTRTPWTTAPAAVEPPSYEEDTTTTTTDVVEDDVDTGAEDTDVEDEPKREFGRGRSRRGSGKA